MPPLPRKSAKLLKQVNGKRHASDDDHDETSAKRRQSPTRQSIQDKQDIYAEPESSDSEGVASTPLRVPTIKGKRPPLKLPSPSVPEDQELKKPQRNSQQQKKKIQPPKRGAYETGQVDKAKKTQIDKENAGTEITSSLPSSNTDNGFQFDMEYSSQKSNKSAKTTFASKKKITNIHTPQPSRKPGSSQSRQSSKVYGKLKVHKQNDVEEYDANISTLGDDELMEALGDQGETVPDPELRTKRVKPRVKEKVKKSGSSSLQMDELDDLFGHKSQEAETELRPKSSKPSRLLERLGDWIGPHAPKTSQPETSGSQDGLDDLKEYMEMLPEEEEEGTRCALCKARVDFDAYWDFWKGQEKTVKNHTTFCHTHRKKTAQEDYKRSKYPDIAWNTLHHRITAHRAQLLKILNNDQQSEHRNRYAPLALTGKAAAVPSKRKDLPTHIQAQLTSHALDDQSIYPGYYGPHGRRLITEIVMRVLKNEIKMCVDPVVQGSGPATFVQAVLVPETAVLLIMEDCGVDSEQAERIREDTYEMGVLVNEEIEDRVEGGGGSEDEDENEYGYIGR